MYRKNNISVHKARDKFPRGLIQPENAYRFSLDALLLAAFCRCEEKRRLLDLGTGCGVAALAALLRAPSLTACGVEREPELLSAASANAEILGLSERFSLLQADITRDRVPADGFDLVISNPPWKSRRQGRLPSSPLRLNALFEEEDTLNSFCRAAARALHPRGRFALVHTAGRLSDTLKALQGAKLSPLRLLCVHPFEGAPARFILIEAAKQGGPAFSIDPPLILYGADGLPSSRFSAFCPEATSFADSAGAGAT